MSVPYLEIITPDGARQLGELNQERVIVGSSPTSHVVVEQPEIGRAHMLLSPRYEGCYVAAARDAPTPVMYNYLPLDRGIVPWGSEIIIGSVRFVLHDGSVPHTLYFSLPPGTKPKAAKKAVSPVVVLACLIAVPAAGWMLLRPSEESEMRTNEKAPPLFDEPVQAQPCPQRDPLQALSIATGMARGALTESTRVPFHFQDGVAAVGDHTLAAGCYHVAGDAAKAEAEMVAARGMIERLNDEYSNHRFRLERALDQDKTEDALVETRMLQHLLIHRRGPYIDWLVGLERRLENKLEEEEAAAKEGGGGL